MIDATMSYEQRIYMLFAGIMTELQSAGLVQGGTPVTAKGKQVFKDLLAIGFHKQVSDDQMIAVARKYDGGLADEMGLRALLPKWRATRG